MFPCSLGDPISLRCPPLGFFVLCFDHARFLFCFRSAFPFFSSPAPARTPVVTCSGRVASVGVGDIVHLVEDTSYVIKKLFPDGRTCLLQRVNDTRPPFRRFLNQLWVPPPPTSESVAEVDLPSTNCLCPDPVAPPLTDEVEVQVDLVKQDAMDEWCSLMTDFSSIENLERAFNDAKKECSQLHEGFIEAYCQLKAVQAEHETVLKREEELRTALKELNETHNSLMADSLLKIDEISDLRSRLARADNSSSNALLSLIRSHLLSLPTDFYATTTPSTIFYHFLCCTPSASDETVALHAKTLLRFLHPDKTSTSYDDPQVNAAAHLVPLITSIKRVLGHTTLRRVYDHCGLYGLQFLLDSDHTCADCLPTDSNGNRLPQGPTAYPQLVVLFHLST